MNCDINGYDTRSTDGMSVYSQKLTKDIYRNSFVYKGGQVGHCLPDVVKDSPYLEAFKYYYKSHNSVTHTWILCYCIHVLIFAMEKHIIKYQFRAYNILLVF